MIGTLSIDLGACPGSTAAWSRRASYAIFSSRGVRPTTSVTTFAPVLRMLPSLSGRGRRGSVLNGIGTSRASGSEDSVRSSIRSADTPSIIAWCTLE